MAGNDETLRLKVEAETDEAKRDLAAVQKQADKLEGETATVEVDADTSQAKADLSDLSDSLGSLPGPAGDVADAIGGMGGGLTGAAGAAGALGAALFAAADHAADVAIEAQTMATLTGDTVEDASALQSVWKNTGADVNDLNDIVLQMQGALATNEESAKKLGININDGKTGGERFVEVMEALRDFTGSAAEKSALMSALLGEEGARQGAKFLSVVEDIDGAIGDLSDEQIITDAEVEKALRFKKTVQDVKQIFADMAVQIGEDVMPALTLLGEATKAVNDVDAEGGGAEGMFGTIKDAALEAFSPAHRFLGIVSDIQDLFGGGDTSATKVAELADNYKDFGSAIAEAASDAKGGADDIAASSELIVASFGVQIESLVDFEQAYRDGQEAQREFFDEQRAAVDSSYAAEKAAQDLLETIQDYGQDVTDAAGDTRKLYDIQVKTKDSAVKYADEQQRAAEKTAELSGSALTAEQSQRIFMTSLLEATALMDGPQKAAVIDYIARMEQIPPEVVTDILADPDNQSIDAAADALDNAARVRTAVINVTLAGVREGIAKAVAALNSAGLVVTGSSAPTPVAPVGPTQHAGPAIPVYAGTTTNNITLNTRATAGRELTRELDRWARLNGRSRR